MKKKDFEVLKEMFKEDIDEGIFLLLVLFLVSYLIFNSKIVLAFVIFIISLLALISYRVYLQKKATITKENKKYYILMGKLLYISILLFFSDIYFTKLFYIIKNISRGSDVALFYPRIILLGVLVILLLRLFYLLRKWSFSREIFFSMISASIIYEILILFFVNEVYGVKISDSHIIYYLVYGFIIILCLLIIWLDAKHEKKP